MSEFDAQERRDFLQFITGSPKLPIGGKPYHLLYIKARILNLSRLQGSHTNVHGRLQAQ
jgi:hypothetical protein